MFTSVAERSRIRGRRRAQAIAVVLALVSGLLGIGIQRAAHAAADANIAVGAVCSWRSAAACAASSLR